MTRRIVSLGLALVLALVGTALIFAYASPGDVAVAQEPQRRVVVATAVVPAGTKGRDAVASKLVAMADVPARLVPAGALTEVGALGDDLASFDIQAGEVVIGTRFISATVAGSLDIPDDKVAISIEVADPQRVAGFVRPGSEVAVFDTYEVLLEPPATRTGEPVPVVKEATRLLLPRATVVAVGPTALRTIGIAPTPKDEDEDDASTSNAEDAETAALVTLAVSIEDAQKLSHAAQTGRLTLGLLSSASRTGTNRADDNRTLFDR